MLGRDASDVVVEEQGKVEGQRVAEIITVQESVGVT